MRSEEHTSELQSHLNLVCRLLLEKKTVNMMHLCKFNYCIQLLHRYIGQLSQLVEDLGVVIHAAELVRTPLL